MQSDAERARVELRAIYAGADAQVGADSRLRCERSGLCCRFRAADQRLYLTQLEYEEMVARGAARAPNAAACPWLERGLCANREGRALACRTYFCSDEALAAEVTEAWHAKIRDLHERHGIPYLYRSLEDHMNHEPLNSSEET